jgi:hypothetical protein
MKIAFKNRRIHPEHCKKANYINIIGEEKNRGCVLFYFFRVDLLIDDKQTHMIYTF